MICTNFLRLSSHEKFFKYLEIIALGIEGSCLGHIILSLGLPRDFRGSRAVEKLTISHWKN